MEIITNSLGSNYTKEDRILALKLLIMPWKWKEGKEIEQLKTVIPAKAGIYTNIDVDSESRKALFGMTYDVQLFLKGRHAIFEALKLADIKPGDEVIVQAFTCLAVVQPIVELGAKPMYVDVKEKFFNPSLSSIKKATTTKTKALILQHTLGFVNPEIEEIAQWCKAHNIFLIQDLAHAFGAPGLQKVGGNAFIFSFSQDKVIDGISGGGLVAPVIPAKAGIYTNINIDSGSQPGMTKWMAIKLLLYPIITHLIRLTYRYRLGKPIHFIARELDLLPAAIEVSDTGKYNPLSPTPMLNACAALALKQLKRFDEISQHRRDIALIYDERLHKNLKIVSRKDILSASNLRYPIWVNNRDELEEKLRKYDFYLVDHWYDAVISPSRVHTESLRYRKGSCPNAQELSKHIFNLPTHTNISIEKAEKLTLLVSRFATQDTESSRGRLWRPWRSVFQIAASKNSSQ